MATDCNYEAMASKVLYQQNNVTISENDGIRLGCYYFPTGQSKTIPWDSIARVELRELKWWQMKTWGTAGADFKVWLHYDRIIREFKSLTGIILHLKKGLISPGLTVVDPAQGIEVFRLIQRKVPSESNAETVL